MIRASGNVEWRRGLPPAARIDRVRRWVACQGHALAFWWAQRRCRHRYALTHLDCRWYWECEHCHREVEIRRSLW